MKVKRLICAFVLSLMATGFQAYRGQANGLPSTKNQSIPPLPAGFVLDSPQFEKNQIKTNLPATTQQIHLLLDAEIGATNSTNLTNNLSTNQNSKGQIRQLKIQAIKGDLESQFFLGLFYWSGKFVTQDYVQAVKWFRMAANQKNPVSPQAQFCLGCCYFHGYGVATNFDEAVKWFSKAAENNSAEAQYNLGNCFTDGNGVATNEVEAVKWYRKAAEQNFPAAQFSLGQAYLLGKGVAKDAVEAVKWYRKAAEQNIVNAQKVLAASYENGEGIAKDLSEAAKWWLRAAEQNDAYSQAVIGANYIHGIGVVKDETEGAKWYLKAAIQNNADAQYRLAICYMNGQGVPKDKVEAAKWYRKAAEQNIVGAQSHLGFLLRDGDGIAKDETEAVKWWRRAAGRGDISAQNALWFAYRHGNGVTQDYVEGLKWIRMAADQGDADAQYYVGRAYEMGEGTLSDFNVASKWYQRAAQQGDLFAQSSLANLYENGKGVTKNNIEAYKWYNLASAHSASNDNDRKFIENNGKLRDFMVKLGEITPEEIAEAQRFSASFVPRKETPNSKSPCISDSPTATGSGFFITDDGYLISNYHVVKGAAKVRLLTGAGLIDATVVKVDAANDLALLKAAGKFMPLPIAASRTVKLGATVATVGFPSTGLQGFSPKLAKGEIGSLAGASDDPRYFQISVPVQPGNSGGALVDARGNVVGIVAAKLSAKAALDATGALPENVNYAVKSSLLLSFLESVPDVAAKLKEPKTKDESFEDVVKSAQDAAVLVLVY